MPQVDITLSEGRSPSRVRELIHEVHAAVLRTSGTRPEYIRVVVHEVPRTHWATGDVTLAEMGSTQASDSNLAPREDDTTHKRLTDIEDQEQQ